MYVLNEPQSTKVGPLGFQAIIAPISVGNNVDDLTLAENRTHPSPCSPSKLRDLDDVSK